MKKNFVIGIAVALLSFNSAMKAEGAVTPSDSDTKGVVNSLNVAVPNVIGMLGGKGRTTYSTRPVLTEIRKGP